MFLGFVFGPAGLVRGAVVVVLVDCDGSSLLRGGASCSQGAAVASLREGGGTAGTYAAGVPGGTGHCPSFGVDIEVVAVVAVFDVGFAYDGFDDRGVAEIVEGFERGARTVGRVGDDVGAGGFLGNEFDDGIGVGGVGRGERHRGDQSGFWFGGDMGLVSRPVYGSGSCDRAAPRDLPLIWSGPWRHAELSAIGLPGGGPVPRLGPQPLPTDPGRRTAQDSTSHPRRLRSASARR